MKQRLSGSYSAFDGFRLVASGTLAEVAESVKRIIGDDHHRPVIVFSDYDCEQVDIDFRGSVEDVLSRLEQDGNAGGSSGDPGRGARGPGRPRLGVVSREVTLLPRHWEWLGRQPSGASASLRRLVDEARRSSAAGEKKRRSRDACFRFMTAIAGNLPGFEEVTRALYAGDRHRFGVLIAEWPADVRDHALELSLEAFDDNLPPDL